MGKDNRPPKHLRTLKFGDVREDGMVFRGYCPHCKTGERWITPEERDELLRKQREYQRNNRDAILARQRLAGKERYQKTKDSRREEKRVYAKERRAKDVNFKLRGNLANRINYALRHGGSKSAKTCEMLGCSIEKLKDHLESQFAEGMTWENYGLNGWHVDHIRPCASFDLTLDEEQKKCFHYTNLQPMWAEDNIQKSSTYKGVKYGKPRS